MDRFEWTRSIATATLDAGGTIEWPEMPICASEPTFPLTSFRDALSGGLSD